MEIIQSYKRIEEIVARNGDLLDKEPRRLAIDYAINPHEEIVSTLEKLKQEDRLLKVGIVGRVKAGKSSLLNALFFDGESILPKAATPMTAALSVLKYGEKLSLKVDFFSHEDIEKIKQEAENCKNEINRKIKEIEETEEEHRRKWKKRRNSVEEKEEIPNQEDIKRKIKKRAEKEVKKDFSDIYASYEQYEKIKDIANYDMLSEPRILELDSFGELDGRLHDYVGEGGKYMPLTKSIEITFPNENLKDLEVVDTPGLNDPVISREQRSRELLKECDVIFIVSPSGQFMNNEDLKLMDRIRDKEGINEIFVIASKIDDQLHGPEVLNKNDRNLFKSCDEIIETLKASLRSTFDKNEGCYIKILENLNDNKETIIFSSGVCSSIVQKNKNNESLDEIESHALNNLKKHYPDFFGGAEMEKASLSRLANVEKIKSLLDEIKSKKEEIKQAKIDKYISTLQTNLKMYRDKLLDYTQYKKEEIENSDIEELKKEQKKLSAIKINISGDIDETYKFLIDNLEKNLYLENEKNINNEFNQAKKEVKNAEDQDSEIRSVKSDGFWAGFKRFFNSGGYEDKSYIINKISTDDVYDAICVFTEHLETYTKYKTDGIVKEWYKDVRRSITETLRDGMGDNNIDIGKLKKTVRVTLTLIDKPELSYGGEMPKELKPYGTIDKDYLIKEYKNKANEYLIKLKHRVIEDIKIYIKYLCEKLRNFNFAKELFNEHDNYIKNLQNQIENKEITLESLKILREKLKEVSI